MKRQSFINMTKPLTKKNKMNVIHWKTLMSQSSNTVKGISKTSSSSSSTSATCEKEKNTLTPDNFPWFVVFKNEFMLRHDGIEAFLGEQLMQNFCMLLQEKFFEWLNYRLNSQKMVYEIKREFMSIAEAVLLFELANHQRRLTPFGFVVGPYQKMLEMIAEEDNPSNFGVIPYSRPLNSPPVSKLEDTKLHIREEEMRLSGVETLQDGGFDLEDVSHFFADFQ